MNNLNSIFIVVLGVAGFIGFSIWRDANDAAIERERYAVWAANQQAAKKTASDIVPIGIYPDLPMKAKKYL